MSSHEQQAKVLAEALPYIQKFTGKTVVVKYGGNAMISQELRKAVMSDIILLNLVGIRVVAVHGGGPEIGAMLKKLGKESKFVDGLRYTDEETMDVVQQILCGKVNKDLVALAQRLGGSAVGLCGLDGGLFQAKLLDEKYGLVGDITDVNPQPVVDEVQTGVGRTGSLFAFQQYGILPDVCSFAKGIAGGLPMSGIMANEKCRNVLTPGTHATTFGANPVCGAAALVVQDVLSDEFLQEVQKKGAYLREQIEAMDLPCFGKTRGLGLMIGIEVAEGYENGKLAAALADAGLLVLTAGPGMRLLPPLVITKEEMDAGLAIMKKTLS